MEENEKKITFGGILSRVVVGIAVFIILILIYFLIDARPPEGVRDILVNETLASADDPTVWYQKRFDQPYYIEGSRFAVNCVRYIKPVNQWQITVQANISVFREFAEKRGISPVPDDFSDFRFRLYDDCGREYTEYDYADFAKSRHRYRRLVFNSVSGNGVNELTVDIYYKEENDPLVSIPVYVKSLPLEPANNKTGSTVYPGLKHN